VIGRSPTVLRNLPTKRGVFAILMVAALVMVLLPASLTGSLQRICRAFFAPTGRMMVLAGRAVREGLSKTDGEQYDHRQQQALENALAAMGHQLQQLRRENQDLTRLRAVAGLTGKLIPARVVGYDSVGHRESIELDRGSKSGVAVKQPVVAGVAEDLFRQKRLPAEVLLASCCLIGRVEYAPGPYTTRVRLLTDPAMRLLGKVGRIVDGQFQTLADVVLEGGGKGRMVATQVQAKSELQVGDLVISQAGQLGLPCSLVVGTVQQVRPRSDNRHLKDLIVLPRIDKRQLDKVFVVAAD